MQNASATNLPAMNFDDVSSPRSSSNADVREEPDLERAAKYARCTLETAYDDLVKPMSANPKLSPIVESQVRTAFDKRVIYRSHRIRHHCASIYDPHSLASTDQPIILAEHARAFQ